ncbi:hypothetical protein CPB84DRAFT_1790468 [Gymnopilus junonius]|uniref:Uncharacterized protein n=1 Tax=Gymnopilus junonius TaxID=109634 RepID=A0A9P5ND06_GYMJU|nr:hypothetical protein CPB84DRAFT_1790468 [Gymnopilus junonius]
MQTFFRSISSLSKSKSAPNPQPTDKSSIEEPWENSQWEPKSISGKAFYSKKTPLRYFGWVITFEICLELADRFKIPADLSQTARTYEAYTQLLRTLPPNDDRWQVKWVHTKRPSRSEGTLEDCISLASNRNAEAIQGAQNKGLIMEIWKILQVKAEPAWFLADMS